MSEPEEDGTGLPLLLKMNQLQHAYQNLTEVDEDGSVVPLKMQASTEFKLKFNEFVHSLLLDCVNHARAQGRKMMMPEDVPALEETSAPEV